MPVADLRFNRRSFLLGVACGSAGTAAVGIFYVLARGGGSPGRESRLEQFISEGNFSPDLGERYVVLENLGDRSVSEFLVEVEAGIGDDVDIRTAIQRRVAADFEDGRICRLDGWFLAETECRLAAVAFLLRRQGRYVEETGLPARGPLDHLPNMVLGRLERWGPRSGEVGKPFNLQSNGNSALWFHITDLGRNPDYEIYMGSEAARTTISTDRDLVTASVTSSQAERLTSVEGKIPVHLVDPIRGKQLIGHLEIQSPAK